MTNERCERCGAVLALVGRVHRCISRVIAPVIVEVTTPRQLGKTDARGTYRYRDPDKWRAYMRAFMKAKRARKLPHG